MDRSFERRRREGGLTPFETTSSRVCNRCLCGIGRGGALVVLPTLVMAGIFISSLAAAGQNTGDKELATQEVPSTFKVQVQRNMVLVRTIVRDAKGHPVSGLKKEDFRLFDNGKPQEIDQFAVESSSGKPALAARTPESEPTGEERAASPPPEDSIPRNYQALYFDDVQMSFEDIAHARDAAERYLTATLTPAGRVGIFTASGQGVLDFTDDRSKLHEALFNIRPRPIYFRESNACPDIGDYQAYLIVDQRDPDALAIATDEYFQCNCAALPAQAQASCLQQAPSTVEGDATRIMETGETKNTQILRGLEQLVRRVALLPGRRSVIFVSPGFLFYHLETQISEISDRALRSNVVVNALDPRGLYVIIPGGDASRATGVIPSGGLAGRKAQLIQNEYSLAEDVLVGLSSDTGGRFFHNSNDLDQGFRQVGTLAEVSYVLAFSPRNLRPDGRFHKLKVTLANPTGFTLQARRGYFAPKASEDAAARAKEEIQDAVYSQDELRELPIEVHTQFFKLNETDVRLSVLTHLDMSSLHFQKAQDRNSDDLTFITVLFDRDGKYLTGKEKKVICHLRDDTLARLTRTGITLKMEFDVKPGTYMVRQIVRDSQAGQLSGLSRTVEIPY